MLGGWIVRRVFGAAATVALLVAPGIACMAPNDPAPPTITVASRIVDSRIEVAVVSCEKPWSASIVRTPRDRLRLGESRSDGARQVTIYDTPPSDITAGEEITISINQGTYHTTVRRTASTVWRAKDGKAVSLDALAGHCRD